MSSSNGRSSPGTIDAISFSFPSYCLISQILWHPLLYKVSQKLRCSGSQFQYSLLSFSFWLLTPKAILLPVKPCLQPMRDISTLHLKTWYFNFSTSAEGLPRFYPTWPQGHSARLKTWDIVGKCSVFGIMADLQENGCAFWRPVRTAEGYLWMSCRVHFRDINSVLTRWIFSFWAIILLNSKHLEIRGIVLSINPFLQHTTGADHLWQEAMNTVWQVYNNNFHYNCDHNNL